MDKIAAIFTLSILFLIIHLAYAENEVFNLSKDNVHYEVWEGFNNDAYGNSSYIDGKFLMWINDTSGGWGLSKLSRGLMPHHWGIRYALLDVEPIFKESNNPDLMFNIELKLNDYLNYTFSNSSMNVAIVLFFD